MYEPEVTIITATSNIVDNDLTDDFTLLVNLLDRQTYTNIEHLVIDNASDDGTDELLKDYKNAGYISFFSEPDNGKYEAYNKGLLRARGKYVAFISCDDFYHDITAINEIVQAMEEDEADFCFFPSYCIHQEGYVFQFEPAIYNIFQVSPCPRQSMFFRKSALEELRGFDTKFKLLADYDLILRLILNGYGGTFIDKNVMTHRLGTQVQTHTVQADAECRHIFYQNYKALYPMSDEDLDRLVQVSELPKPLLDKLALNFPDNKEEFYEQYNKMYEMRSNVFREQRQQNRRRR